MPRTRGQEEKLVERGIPPTPPQQLHTPRRGTKAKVPTRKTRENGNVPSTSSRPAPARGRVTRARTNSASQSDQSVQPVQPTPKKRSRTVKVSKVSKRTVEKVTEEAQPIFEAPEESTEEDTGLAQQAPSGSVKPSKQKHRGRTALQNMESPLQNGNQTIDHTKSAPIARGRPTTKRKALQIDQIDPENASPKRVRLSLEHKKRVPVLFDENGMLSLRAYKETSQENELSSDEEMADKSAKPLDGAFMQDQQQIEQLTETPQPRGWALSNFIPSAQTVTRFLPIFSVRTPAIVPTSPSVKPSHKDRPSTPTPTIVIKPQKEVAPITPEQPQKMDRSTHSEPHPVIGDGERGRRTDYEPAATARTSRRRQDKPRYGLKTRGEREEIKKRDEMIASLRAQLAVQTESHAQKEAQAEKAAQAKMDLAAQIKAEALKVIEQSPSDPPKQGTKRKAKSPKVIPNPPGGGFGMVLEFFGQDSDDDDDDNVDAAMNGVNVEVAPTQPPSKKTRLSGSSAPMIVGNPFRATPYTGTALALPPLPPAPASPHDSIMDTTMDMGAEHDLSSAPDVLANGPTLTFTVPSPSDSDDDSDVSDVDSSHTPPTLGSTRTSRPSLRDAELPSFSTSKPKTQPSLFDATPKQPLPMSSNIFEMNGPAAPPQMKSQNQTEPLFPGTWTSPSSRQTLQTSRTPTAPNMALDRARQTALKHKPQQPSRLRESSRLSSSTVGLDSSDDKVPNHSGENQATKPNQGTFEEPDTKDPYAGRMMRPSPRNPMILEPVPMPSETSPLANNNPNADGESSSDKSASDQDLPEEFPNFESYDKYQRALSSQVNDFLVYQWADKKAHLGAEASAVVTEQFGEYETQLGQFSEKTPLNDFSANMRGYIGSTWDRTDENTATEKLDNEFETWLELPV